MQAATEEVAGERSAEPETRPRAPRRARAVRIAVAAALCAALLVLALGAAAVLLVLGSLPRTAGELRVPGIAAPVDIERDALGVVRVRASSLADAVFAQGFVHAQDRYFQMDLNRRYVAGELAEFLGDAALASDRAMRRLRYRARAAELLEELPAEHLALVEAYTAGVNAGLASLRVRPPEYLMLRTAPEPWRPEDSVVAGLLFHVGLSRNDSYERPLGVVRAALRPELFEFLTPDASRWDAVVDAADGDSRGGYSPAPIPGPDIVDLRGATPVRLPRRVVRIYGDLGAGVLPGSNSWAIAGTRTRHGGAIVANDPHLGLSVPNIWHRSELEWPDGAARGVVMPGLPGIAIGSTNHVAWGFTNAVADQTDLVVVEVDAGEPGSYLTPDGPEPFREYAEVVRIRGSPPDTVVVRETRWGPVVGSDWRGRPLALRSTVWEPGGVGMEYLELLHARSVDDAVAVLRRWGAPAMNGVLGDRDGRVAFVLTGPLPRRVGFDGRSPVSWARQGIGWNGLLPERERPVVVDPAAGFVVTANNRLVDVAHSRRLGRAWVAPTRARRIHDILSAGYPFDELESLRLQLDTRSLGHEPARDLVLETVEPGEHEPDPLLRRARQLVAHWSGRADAEDGAFLLLQAFNEELRERLLVPLLAPALDADPELVFNWPLAHETALRILDERPPHLLPPGYADWRTFLRSALLEAAERVGGGDPDNLGREWGDANRAAILHPFGGSGLAGRVLDMPPDPLPGWIGTVRAQAPGYGASMRMVVGPARPEAGLLHMPGGQSGHFLSRHYRDGHDAWVEGRPAPFLAGDAVRRLRLEPAGEP